MNWLGQQVLQNMQGFKWKEKEPSKEKLNFITCLILSVGYQVNSRQGTLFQIWATPRLKDYLVQGYVINEKRLAQKQHEVQTLKDGIRILIGPLNKKLMIKT